MSRKSRQMLSNLMMIYSILCLINNLIFTDSSSKGRYHGIMALLALIAANLFDKRCCCEK